MSLDILVFLGSARDSAPPRPARYRARRELAVPCSDRETEPRLIDALEWRTGGVFKPHFAFATGKAPEG